MTAQREDLSERERVFQAGFRKVVANQRLSRRVIKQGTLECAHARLPAAVFFSAHREAKSSPLLWRSRQPNADILLCSPGVLGNLNLVENPRNHTIVPQE